MRGLLLILFTLTPYLVIGQVWKKQYILNDFGETTEKYIETITFNAKVINQDKNETLSGKIILNEFIKVEFDIKIDVRTSVSLGVKVGDEVLTGILTYSIDSAERFRKIMSKGNANAFIKFEQLGSPSRTYIFQIPKLDP